MGRQWKHQVAQVCENSLGLYSASWEDPESNRTPGRKQLLRGSQQLGLDMFTKTPHPQGGKGQPLAEEWVTQRISKGRDVKAWGLTPLSLVPWSSAEWTSWLRSQFSPSWKNEGSN